MLLGDANCHMQALNDEPYYAAGSSGGWGNVVDEASLQLIKHKYEKVARSISCETQVLQANCRHVLLDQCRVSDHLSFCEELTCPLHHHHSYFGSSSKALLQDWHSIWHHESHYYLHSTGTLVGLVCCVVVVVSIGVYNYHYHSKSKFLKDGEGVGGGSGSNRTLDTLDPRISRRPEAGRFLSGSSLLRPELSAPQKLHPY